MIRVRFMFRAIAHITVSPSLVPRVTIRLPHSGLSGKEKGGDSVAFLIAFTHALVKQPARANRQIQETQRGSASGGNVADFVR